MFSPFTSTPPRHTQFELPILRYNRYYLRSERSGNLIIILLNRRVVGGKGCFWSLKSPGSDDGSDVH